MCTIYSVLKQIKAKEACILVIFHLEDSLVDSGGVLHTCELRMYKRQSQLWGQSGLQWNCLKIQNKNKLLSSVIILKSK